MRIRIDIPKRLYSKVEQRAQAEGIALDEFIARAIRILIDEAKPGKRCKLPIIESDRPGSLHLDNAKIYELIDFP
jgi:metal-responsive CopG/Arc/MetJ family transcriptional regulator